MYSSSAACLAGFCGIFLDFNAVPSESVRGRKEIGGDQAGGVLGEYDVSETSYVDQVFNGLHSFAAYLPAIPREHWLAFHQAQMCLGQGVDYY